MERDIAAHTQLEHAPDHIVIVIVAGPTEAVERSFSVKNFCLSARLAKLPLNPLSFFAWLLQVRIYKDDDMQRGVTTVFDKCIGPKRRAAILSSALPLILALDPCLRDWTHFVRRLELPPGVKYIERNSRLEDFGQELSVLSKLNRFKSLVEITIGKVRAQVQDELRVTHAMNIGDTERQLKNALQRCLVCGRPNVRKHCPDCGGLYCSREHQVEDWSRHKAHCKAVMDRGRRVHTNVMRMAKNKGWTQLWYDVNEVPHPWLIRKAWVKQAIESHAHVFVCVYIYIYMYAN